MIINYFLALVSMASMVLNDSFRNLISKRYTQNNRDIYRCNVLVYSVCFMIFLCLAFINGISFFTLWFGILFGIVTAVANMSAMAAFRTGPMNISSLIAASSMIIPALSGWALFGDEISIYKVIAIIVLLGFIYLALGKSDGKKINRKWAFYALCAFLLRGLIGVMQKIHQSSAYKEELFAFLAAAFLCSAIYSFIKGRKSDTEFPKSIYALLFFMGVATFTMNFLNLKLAGIIPTVIFFPLVNGGNIIINFAVSLFVFKEKITKLQLVGFLGGILSLIALCIL